MMPSSCQTLAEGEIWHMDDFSIDCDSSTHVAMMIVAGICIVLYPIGIPVVFLFLLRRDEQAGKQKELQRYQAAGSRQETDERGSSSFDFLKKDYKPEFYFFEAVNLMEKLIISGLLVFVDQGSIFQCFAGSCIAFAFFAIQVTTWPYTEKADNLLKAVAEGQLFLTLLLSIVLRTANDALVADALGEDDYGAILVVAFFAAPSVELVIVARRAYQFCIPETDGKKKAAAGDAAPAEPLGVVTEGVPPLSQASGEEEHHGRQADDGEALRPPRMQDRSPPRDHDVDERTDGDEEASDEQVTIATETVVAQPDHQGKEQPVGENGSVGVPPLAPPSQSEAVSGFSFLDCTKPARDDQ